MSRTKPKYKLIKSRAATMDDVNLAALRSIEYLIEQGVLKDDTLECDELYDKIACTISEFYDNPDYSNYN